jgi:hypothetical protein
MQNLLRFKGKYGRKINIISRWRIKRELSTVINIIEELRAQLEIIERL